MSTANPYQAPRANVERDEEYSEVKFFSTKGRLGRVRYIAYSLGVWVLTSIIGGLIGGAAALAHLAVGGVADVRGVAAIIGGGFAVPLAIRRAHDFDAGSWWSLLAFVPLVNLMFLFKPGTDGENRFGKKTPPNSGGVIAAALVMPLLFIVGIAAAIAIPAYQSYAQRAHAAQLSHPQQ
ncbi:MAG: DUF805 domain-containing protein [Betaproteobacteria bacterium]|nr:DUF805 domain-containing protein [Betaproteobacteria bacterium]